MSKVLVLGAYGLIGSAITAALLQRGDAVVGLARSKSRGERRFPRAEWIGADLADLRDAGAWAVHLDGVDAVVNAAGALQSGPGVDLRAIQSEAIAALIAACEGAGIKKFVQISAPGAEVSAETEFMATKAGGDAAMRDSGLDWVILKPGLVLAQDSYGGTNLLRMVAAFPLVQPLLMADARVQTVDVADVAGAVGQALDDPQLARQEFDLVEAEDHSLGEVILAFRAFMGFPPPRLVWRLPDFCAGAVSAVADAASWLGWNSALRSTALKVLTQGVRGDSAAWIAAGGLAPKPLSATLARLNGTAQDRIFARTRLVFPLALVMFSAFWIISGLIGFAQRDAAVAVIAGVMGQPLANLFVLGGSVADLAVGLALLVRPLLDWACIGAVVLALAYLVAGTIFTPEIWLDPLGPFVKVLPVLVLAPVLMAMRPDR